MALTPCAEELLECIVAASEVLRYLLLRLVEGSSSWELKQLNVQKEMLRLVTDVHRSPSPIAWEEWEEGCLESLRVVMVRIGD